jgi:hypothetical protein
MGDVRARGSIGVEGEAPHFRFTTMIQRLAGLLVAALVALSTAPAAALTIEGQTFADRVELANAPLELNGVGLRAVAWLKGYAAGLYLQRPAATPDEAVAMPGPKRLQIRMLVDVGSEEFAKALRKGIARNTPVQDRARLADRVTRFDQAILAVGQVKKGDVVNLDYLPGQGMAMTLNGASRGPVLPGEDFYAAVLRIFLGERPVDDNLKAGLLRGRGG